MDVFQLVGGMSFSAGSRHFPKLLNPSHVSPRLATVAPRLVVAVEHLPSILGAQVFEPDVSERLTVGVAMGLGVSATGGV